MMIVLYGLHLMLSVCRHREVKQMKRENGNYILNGRFKLHITKGQSLQEFFLLSRVSQEIALLEIGEV